AHARIGWARGQRVHQVLGSERHGQVHGDRKTEQQAHHRQLSRLARPMLPHEGGHLRKAGFALAVAALVVVVVYVTHRNTDGSRPRARGFANLEMGTKCWKRSVEDAKSPATRLGEPGLPRAIAKTRNRFRDLEPRQLALSQGSTATVRGAVF